jgi:hypothetical protein
MKTYHPDPAIDAEITKQANESDVADMAAGFGPKWWQCPTCSASHQRGHFGVIGNHRCMNCGYVGGGGTLHTKRP